MRQVGTAQAAGAALVTALLMGPALAQKPGSLPPQAQVLPTVKPLPLGVPDTARQALPTTPPPPLPPVTAAPAPGGKPPTSGQLPATPPAAAAPVPAIPPLVARPPVTAAPEPGGKPPTGGPAPATPPVAGSSSAPTPPLASLPPPPADEPPEVARLRSVFGPGVQMAYARATVVDQTAGRVRLEEVRLQRENASATIAELTVEGQRDDGVREITWRDLRTVEVPNAERPTRVQVERGRISGLTLRRPADGSQPGPGDVTLDRVALEGVRIDGDGDIAMREVVLDEYGPGRRTRFRLEGFEASRLGPEGYGFSLGRLALGGVPIADIATALVASRAVPMLTGRMELLAETFVFREMGRQLGSVETFRAETESDASESGTARIAVRGLGLDGVPQLAAQLARLGYQSLSGDITADMGYQAQGGRVSIPALTVAAPGYGSITLSLEAQGVDRSLPPEALTQAMQLVSASLRYRDDGLFPRVLRMQAAQQRVTEQQLREQALAMARAFISGPAALVLREPIERFLRGQASELELAVRPPQPLGLTTMQQAVPTSAEEAQRIYGLTATAR